MKIWGFIKAKKVTIIFWILFIAILVLWICDCITSCFSNVGFMSSELIKELLGITQTLLIIIFINKELRAKEKITKKSLDLEEQGITGVNKNGVMTVSEKKDLFLNSDEIKICAVCGKNFFSSNKALFIKSLEKGTKIKLLVSNPYSVFLSEVTEHLDAIHSIEHNQMNHQQQEIFDLITLIDEVNKNSNTKIQISFFNTEYRVPFFLAFQHENKEQIIKGWYNSIIPVRSPRQMIMFSGKIEESERENYIETTFENEESIKLKENVRNFIFDLDVHFDYVWKKHYEESQKTLNEIKQE